MTIKRIYTASSWRNPGYPEVVLALRKEGHEVYDFRNPPNKSGFAWGALDPNWESWSPEAFRRNLDHPIAESGFSSDYEAMQWADEFCLVLPCGRSAHLEAGWAAGQGKRVSIYMPVQVEPELMYKTGGERTRICVNMDELLAFHAEAAGNQLSRSQRQQAATDWAKSAFGLLHATHIKQRALRMLEEAIELYQACGGNIRTGEDVLHYVFNRPKGEIGQELGGLGVTLLVLAQAAGLDADAMEQREVERILSLPFEHFQKRDDIKCDHGLSHLDDLEDGLADEEAV